MPVHRGLTPLPTQSSHSFQAGQPLRSPAAVTHLARSEAPPFVGVAFNVVQAVE
ncbi:hypothetical protein P7K49_018503, partial [Saguinus oedipus]